MGQQVCCVTACNYGQDGQFDAPQQRGGTGSSRSIATNGRDDQGNLYVMNSMGLRVEKLEEDYVSDPSDDDDEDVFSDQLNYKQESMV